MTNATNHLKAIAQRLVNADTHFITMLSELHGFSEADATKIFETCRKLVSNSTATWVAGMSSTVAFLTATFASVPWLTSPRRERKVSHMRLSIENLVAHLFLFGAFVGSDFSVGRHTPATPDGYAYEVCVKNGTPVLLCHDEVQAAVWFDRIAFEDGLSILAPTLEEGYAATLPSAEDIEADR